MIRIKLRLQYQSKLLDLAKQDSIFAATRGSFFGLAAAAAEAVGPGEVRWRFVEALDELGAEGHHFLQFFSVLRTCADRKDFNGRVATGLAHVALSIV